MPEQQDGNYQNKLKDISKILEPVNVLALFVHFICISLEFQKEIEYFDHINIKKLLKLLKMC